MKYKIKKITKKKFGKIYEEEYRVMNFGNDHIGIMLWIITPILCVPYFESYFFLCGWIGLIIFNPFKKKWRTLKCFNKHYEALYFIKNDEKEYETNEEFVK